MITEPLHVAIVNDKQLRFFHDSALRSIQPEEALQIVRRVPRKVRTPVIIGRVTTMLWNGPYEEVFHTVETSDGLVAIAPHCVALATIFSQIS